MSTSKIRSSLAKEKVRLLRTLILVIQSFPRILARPITFHDAETRLKQALADVVKFADGLTNFADWWNNMKTDLLSLKRGVKSIKLDGSNPLRDETVRNGWVKVKGKYQVYQNQVRFVPFL